MTIEEIEDLLSESKGALKADKYHEAEMIALQVIDILSKDSGIHTLSMTIEYRFVLICRANRFVSQSYLRRGKAKEGLVFAESALDSAKKANSQVEEATVLSDIGGLYNLLSDYNLAIEYLNEALSISTKLGLQSLIAMVSGNLGMVYRNLSEHTIALKYMYAALDVEIESENKEDLLRLMNNIGLVHKDNADYEEALIIYKRAIHLCEKHNIFSIKSSLYSNISRVYMLLSNYQISLEYLTKALIINQQLDRKSAVAQTLSDIGLLYKELGDLNKSLEFQQNALLLFNELGLKGKAAKSIGNIGLIYQEMGKYQDTLDCYLQATNIFEVLNMKGAYAIGIGNIGGAYVLLGNFELASEYLLKGLELHTESGSKALVAITLGNIGVLYSTKGFSGYDRLKAEEFLFHAIDLNEKLCTKHHLYDNQKALANLYEQECETEKALHHYKKYHELYIEVQNEEVKKQADKFAWERKIVDMENEREIELLKTEAEKTLLNETILHQKKRLETQAFEVENSIQELVKKNGLLQQIQSDISKITPHTMREGIDFIDQLQDRVSRHITPLDSVRELDKQWTVIHSCFIKNLQQSFPDLTTMELKIAVLLNMKFTSANIGSALFLAKRTVEFHRHNLRRKMGLGANEDIYQILSKYSTQ